MLDNFLHKSSGPPQLALLARGASGAASAASLLLMMLSCRGRLEL